MISEQTPGRGQLVSAAINVTRAFSQFLGAAIQVRRNLLCPGKLYLRTQVRKCKYTIVPDIYDGYVIKKRVPVI